MRKYQLKWTQFLDFGDCCSHLSILISLTDKFKISIGFLSDLTTGIRCDVSSAETFLTFILTLLSCKVIKNKSASSLLLEILIILAMCLTANNLLSQHLLHLGRYYWKSTPQLWSCLPLWIWDWHFTRKKHSFSNTKKSLKYLCSAIILNRIIYNFSSPFPWSQ